MRVRDLVVSLSQSLVIAAGLAGLVVACDGGQPDPEPSKLSELTDDIFIPRCGASVCHGGGGPARDLDLVNDPFGSLVNVASVANPDILRVKPGDADNSLLIQCLLGEVDDLSTGAKMQQMPVGATLDDSELAQIRSWIDDGAQDN